MVGALALMTVGAMVLIPSARARGWVKLYCSTVQQADKGVDLDFLVGSSGAPVGRESH